MSSTPTNLPPWEALTRLRRRFRWLVWCSGLSRGLLALLGGLMVAGWLDWWWRINDVGVRVVLAAGVWGAVTWTLWRGLVQPLRLALTDVFFAEQIDRRYPGLSNRLKSAAEFRARRLDPGQGSTELQQLVIRQATEDLREIRPDDLIDPLRLSPLVVGALIACGMAGCVLWAFPLEAATAVRRVAWPWGRTPWPRSTVLQLSYPDGRPLEWSPREALQVVRGETLKLRVENLRGPLPEDLTLQLREPGQEFPEESAVHRVVRSDAQQTAMEIAPLEILVQRDAVEFRVWGGDDHTLPWHTLAAVDPPRIAAMHIEVTPPTYLGRAPEVLPAGSTQIRGWLGSVIKVRARADRPVSRLELRVSDQPSRNIPVADDGRSWETELQIDRAGASTFAFVLRDAQGFAEHQPLQFEVRGEVDAIPEVVLTEPATDQWVTPAAILPLLVEARDDLGLKELARTWQRDNGGTETQLLIEFPDAPQQARYGTNWQLQELNLQPGERVVFRIEALDACDQGEPHIGKSAPRSLLVVSPHDKQRELNDRVAEIVDELREALTQQERLAEQTNELQTQLQDVGRLQATDRDLLNRLEAEQRRLATRLGDETRGLQCRAQRLRDEFPANQLTDSEAEPQLEQLAQELRELAESAFPAIESELTQASKDVDAARVPDQPQEQPAQAGDNLAQAERLQRRVIHTLVERQQELAKWQSDRNLGEDLKSLATDQQKLNEDSSQLGAETLSKSLPELSPQNRADLNKLADRQRLLSQRIEQLQESFRKTSEGLEESDAGRAAEALDIADQLSDSQVSMRLRQAGDDLAANRLGSAGQAQQEAEETLKELSRQWSEGRPDDTEQMLKRTEAAEQAAQELSDELDQLRKQVDETDLSQAGTETREQLQEQALELRRRAERLERELERLRLKRGDNPARRAAQRLKAGEQALAAGDGDAAQNELEAAQEEVEQLQQEIAESRRQVEERLAQEELEKIAGTLLALKTRQDGVIVETERLENERQSTGRLTRGQLRTLQDLAAIEQELKQLATDASRQLEEAVVAQSALASVARSLDRAAGRLADRQTDTVTLMLERDASKRLERILAAWNRREEDPPSGEGDPPGNEDTVEQPQQGVPPGEDVSFKLQLALLRELQADCLDRTVVFEQLRQPDGSLSEDLLPLVVDLAREQGDLVDLAQQLAKAYRESLPSPAKGDAPLETPQ